MKKMTQKVSREIGTSLNVAELTVVPLSISILDFLEESATTPGSTATAAGIKTVLKTTNAALVPAILRNSFRVIFFMSIKQHFRNFRNLRCAKIKKLLLSQSWQVVF